MLDGPTEVNVGSGTLTTKEPVEGLDIETMPVEPGLTVVAGGTIGDVIVKFGYVPVMLDGPTEVNVGDGALTTNELVAGLDTETIPPGLIEVLGVAAGTVGDVIVRFG